MHDFLWYIHMGGILELAKDTSFTRRSCQGSKCLCWSFHFRWPHRMWESFLLGEWHLLDRVMSRKSAVLNPSLKCPVQMNLRVEVGMMYSCFLKKDARRGLKPLLWFFPMHRTTSLVNRISEKIGWMFEPRVLEKSEEFGSSSSLDLKIAPVNGIWKAYLFKHGLPFVKGAKFIILGGNHVKVSWFVGVLFWLFWICSNSKVKVKLGGCEPAWIKTKKVMCQISHEPKTTGFSQFSSKQKCTNINQILNQIASFGPRSFHGNNAEY